MADRKIFENSYIPFSDAETQFASAAATDQAALARLRQKKLHITFHFGLSAQQHEELNAAVEGGQPIDRATMNTRYGISSGTVKPFTDWLTKSGFEVRRVAADGQTVHTRALPETIEAVLQTN